MLAYWPEPNLNWAWSTAALSTVISSRKYLCVGTPGTGNPQTTACTVRLCELVCILFCGPGDVCIREEVESSWRWWQSRPANTQREISSYLWLMCCRNTVMYCCEVGQLEGMHGWWISSELEIHWCTALREVNGKCSPLAIFFCLSQVQVAKPGGGRVLQRPHPRGGRRQPGAPTEVWGEEAEREGLSPILYLQHSIESSVGFLFHTTTVTMVTPSYSHWWNFPMCVRAAHHFPLPLKWMLLIFEFHTQHKLRV